MATYVIGDLQGCFDSLIALLNAVNFDEKRDKLWFVGDLINRGKKSLQCINFVRNLVEKNRAITVLGNHDVFLLLCAENLRKPHPSDTLDEILNLPKSELTAILNWIRKQKFCHLETIGDRNFLLTHAGIFPTWSLQETLQKAKQVQTLLQSDNRQQYLRFLQEIWGDANQNIFYEVDSQNLYKNQQFSVNVFTRMRFCKNAENSENSISLDFAFKGEIQNAPEHLVAWFDLYKKYQNPAWQNTTILFGHWSALGLKIDENFDYVALDSGCLWGRKLTALRLEDRKVFQVNSAEE